MGTKAYEFDVRTEFQDRPLAAEVVVYHCHSAVDFRRISQHIHVEPTVTSGPGIQISAGSIDSHIVYVRSGNQSRTVPQRGIPGIHVPGNGFAFHRHREIINFWYDEIVDRQQRDAFGGAYTFYVKFLIPISRRSNIANELDTHAIAECNSVVPSLRTDQPHIISGIGLFAYDILLNIVGLQCGRCCEIHSFWTLEHPIVLIVVHRLVPVNEKIHSIIFLLKQFVGTCGRAVYFFQRIKITGISQRIQHTTAAVFQEYGSRFQLIISACFVWFNDVTIFGGHTWTKLLSYKTLSTLIAWLLHQLIQGGVKHLSVGGCAEYFR